MRTGSTFVAALVTSLLALSATADQIERTDGRVVKGRIIQETKDEITIEARSGDLMVTQRVKRANIRSIQRDARQGPGYCVIPIEGAIGDQVTPQALRRALADAKELGASIIILQIDSLGGWINARDDMLEVLRDQKDMRLVAHVKQAISSAAVLTLACREIYMAERATMGAAVAYRVTKQGTAAPLEAKYRSAVQAGERAAAAMGGHSDLWIRGMSETDIELAIVEENGKPIIVEAGTRPGAAAAEKVIKRKGQVLTLTAEEAREWGLSNGTATTLEDLRKALGIEKWHSAGDGPTAIMVAQNRRAKAKAQDEQYRMKEIARIDTVAGGALKSLAAASAELDRINALVRREAGPVLAQAQARLQEARQTGASQQEIEAIEAAAQRYLDQVRGRYQEQIDAAQRAGTAATKELNELRAKRADLVAGLGQ